MNEKENGGIFDGIVEGSSVNQVDNTGLSNNTVETIGFNIPNYVEPQPTLTNNNNLVNGMNEVIGFNNNTVSQVETPLNNAEVIGGYTGGFVEQPVEVAPIVDVPVEQVSVPSQPIYSQNDNVIMDYVSPQPTMEVVSPNPVSNDIIDYAVPTPESIIDYGSVQSNGSEVINFENNVMPQVETPLNNAEIIGGYTGGFVEQSVEVAPIVDVPVEQVSAPSQPIYSQNDNVIMDYVSPQPTVEVVNNPIDNSTSGFSYDFNFENQVQHIEPVNYSQDPQDTQPVAMNNEILMPEVSMNETVGFENNVMPQVEQPLNNAEVIGDYSSGFVGQPVEVTPMVDVPIESVPVETLNQVDNNIEVMSDNTQIIDTQLIQDNVETMSVDSDGSIINPNIIVNPIIQNLNTGPEILNVPVEEPRVNYEKIAHKKKMMFLGIFFGLLVLFILLLPKIMELFG